MRPIAVIAVTTEDNQRQSRPRTFIEQQAEENPVRQQFAGLSWHYDMVG